MNVVVSVVIPVKNGGNFINECLESLLRQDYKGDWEVSIYNDGSEDNTLEVIESYQERFSKQKIQLSIHSGEVSGGVGFAKNQAVRFSSGKYLCFHDADDISHSSRLKKLVEYAETFPDGTKFFFGSCFKRIPENSTLRYTRWANSLTNNLLDKQVYTSNGPTLIAPTWFLPRSLYDEVLGFRDDVKKGFPEDLEFFYKTLSLQNVLYRKIDEDLVKYRYHDGCESLSVHEDTLWDLRLEHLRKHIFPQWGKFSIWSVGKQGKRFFKSLRSMEKNNVEAFCDVDPKKIKRGMFEEFDDVTRTVTHKIPILSIQDVNPPVIVCVKLDMTGGDLESLISLKNWEEGKDFVLFS